MDGLGVGELLTRTTGIADSAIAPIGVGRQATSRSRQTTSRSPVTAKPAQLRSASLSLGARLADALRTFGSVAADILLHSMR